MKISKVKLPRVKNGGPLRLKLLCIYPFTVCWLGYHGLWIRASPFLQTAKELYLLIFKHYTLSSISLYFPLHMIGAVVLIPPP